MAKLAELICDVGNPDSMQLLSFSASEGLSQPFEYQVEILCSEPDLKLADFLGTGMKIELKLPGGKRYFHGLVARFAHSGRRTRQFYHYQATLRPWFWFLSRTQDCRIFQEKTVIDIIKDVFNDHGGLVKFKNSATASYGQWEYCVQYRESDMNFVSRMMEQEGIYYYFDHTSSGHEMVLCDAPSAHAAVPDYGTILYEADPDVARDGIDEIIQNWSVGVQVQPTKVMLADFDFTRPSTQLRKESQVTREHANNTYEVFDYPGEYALDADGMHYAKMRAQEQQAGYQVASAQTTARGLTCGKTFRVRGLLDEALDQEYLVLSTQIHIEEGLQIGGEDSRDGHFSCAFRAMPSSDQFRAPRVTPKPMVYGPQTAFVVGPSGEPIYTDQYGRIKVQFHWDRLGQKNEQSTCWIRVSQPWAGKGFGAISIPRIGDEVVVSFLEGDPDQPLVTGRVYNAEFMPPYKLPDKSYLTGILTRSMGDDAAAKANELRFSDKPGEEYIWVQAQKDYHREVENDVRDTVKNDHYIEVTGKREEKIGGTMDQTVGGVVKTTYGADHHHDVGADFIVKSGGVVNLNAGKALALKVGEKGGVEIAQALDVKSGQDMSVESGTNFSVKGGQDVVAEGGMNVHIKGGMNVTIEAGMTLTLKTSSSSVVIGPSGVTIDGPMVKVNCGGGGGSAKAAKAAQPEAPADPQAAAQPAADANPDA